MKNNILLISLTFVINLSVAQSLPKMAYQAVIRNSTNALVTNANIGMRVSILQESEFGAAVFVETHTPMTNMNGLVTIEIGGGLNILGNLSSIEWQDGPYFIKTETDIDGGSNYTLTFTQKLLSVPYALYAEKSANSNIPGPKGDTGPQGPIGPKGDQGPIGDSVWSKSGNSIFYNKGGVGIGMIPNFLGLSIKNNGFRMINSSNTEVLSITNDVTSGSPIFKMADSEGRKSIDIDGRGPFFRMYHKGNNVAMQIGVEDNAAGRSFIAGDIFIAHSHIEILDGGVTYPLNYGFLNNEGKIGTAGGQNNYSIFATSRVAASEFNAHSDRRIKKDIFKSDNCSDLLKVLKLKVSDYRLCDSISAGTDQIKGFIAQEVQEVLPNAIRKITKFIPSIYSLASSSIYDFDSSVLTIKLPKIHGLEIKDKVKLIFENSTKDLIVKSVIDKYTFQLECSENNLSKKPEVFVFGKEVDDFLTIDYNQLVSLSISGIQALIAENNGIKSKLENLEVDLNSRLANLELIMLNLKEKSNVKFEGNNHQINRM
ncbi:MAG: hypothetical protein HOP11_13275 [Saprospiraceae bacterium]|nr:hypothetical protein [Saprospiraceae bacterium]